MWLNEGESVRLGRIPHFWGLKSEKASKVTDQQKRERFRILQAKSSVYTEARGGYVTCPKAQSKTMASLARIPQAPDCWPGAPLGPDKSPGGAGSLAGIKGLP